MNRQWTIEEAQSWHSGKSWFCGFNYVPRYAVNSTEQWQDAAFDSKLIDEELGWAEAMGLRSCRVFLQYLVWRSERAAFTRNFSRFLALAARRRISVMPVLFDDCGFSGKQPYLGPQDAPVPGIHNSGWTPCPGIALADSPERWNELQEYVADIVGRHRRDERILAWDIYNEPGGSNRNEKSIPLLRAAFAWARAQDPIQPLTAGAWGPDKPNPCDPVDLELSDIITFHAYGDRDAVARTIAGLGKYRRPMICTEWMARSAPGNEQVLFTHLPLFKAEKVSSYVWGLAHGKTQTHYPWGSKPGGPEPSVWFHDLLHPDGRPYRQAEVDFIKTATHRQTIEIDVVSGTLDVMKMLEEPVSSPCARTFPTAS